MDTNNTLIESMDLVPNSQTRYDNSSYFISNNQGNIQQTSASAMQSITKPISEKNIQAFRKNGMF